MKTFRVIVSAGSVRHELYGGMTYEEALRFCEEENWQCDWNEGLVWDMEIEEED